MTSWSRGRVNSFVSGKGGARKADADLLKGGAKKKTKKAGPYPTVPNRTFFWRMLAHYATHFDSKNGGFSRISTE